MAARDKERYYWLKLHKDFFKRHDITVIEDMPNGKDYVLFYLKLMLESVDHEGALRFSDTIPYSESMLASVTHTNVDVVRSALKILRELGMVEVFDDKTLFMTEVAKLLDSETYAARRKREQRNDITGDNVPRLSPGCPQEKEIDTEKESDIKTDTEDLAEEEDARAGHQLYDPGLGKVMTYFMDKINPMPSPIAIGEIQFYLHKADLDPDVIIHAMQIAVDEKKTSWSYIRAILQRYANSGLNTMSLVLSSEQQFEQKKASTAQAPQKRSSKGESAVSDLLSLHRRYEEQS